MPLADEILHMLDGTADLSPTRIWLHGSTSCTTTSTRPVSDSAAKDGFVVDRTASRGRCLWRDRPSATVDRPGSVSSLG